MAFTQRVLAAPHWLRFCRRVIRRAGGYLFLAAVSTLVACGGVGSSSTPGSSSHSPAPPAAPAPPPAPTLSDYQAARFLNQATFGATTDTIATLKSQGLENWFNEQIDLAPSLHLTGVLNKMGPEAAFLDADGETLPGLAHLVSDSFWQTAIEADDQLRQRMAYALSQTLVISTNGNLEFVPHTVAHYIDILTQGAFGNYRDLLENVTYSPAMAVYLTYLYNHKATE